MISLAKAHHLGGIILNNSEKKSEQNTPIKVCVSMIAYNHALYIENAIKGVLMQEADFEIILVIGEDCSSDSTRQICERYALQNPKKVKLLDSIKNYGIQGNVFRTAEACFDYTYIAFCEGDDVWIDKHKLQHQVDFLEKNRNYKAHAHNVIHRNLTTKEIGRAHV